MIGCRKEAKKTQNSFFMFYVLITMEKILKFPRLLSQFKATNSNPIPVSMSLFRRFISMSAHQESCRINCFRYWMFHKLDLKQRLLHAQFPTGRVDMSQSDLYFNAIDACQLQDDLHEVERKISRLKHETCSDCNANSCSDENARRA